MDIDIAKPLIRGVRILVDKKPLWIKLGYIKLLDHVYLRCDSYNPQSDEALLQYGEWLRASPLKSRRRSTEAEMREEKKLYLAFKSSNKVRVKLTFNSPNPKQRRHIRVPLDPQGESPSHMLIDGGPWVLDGSEGLALLWERHTNFQFLSASSNHIDSMIRWEREEYTWRFTEIYGDLRYKTLTVESRGLWSFRQMDSLVGAIIEHPV
ncbi:LOW QUALITY PROTEIN: hypothetical protein Cgig2_018887 [Carnegiea gigantea]|uniref:Uncharacterized protein n=1 Tax=Carnegiea gigantea TaxID=171969 RepID=A0A9Q1QEV9_9CARY|nr:LOW QUALITY PROTEIN: hypothetical protein Cgig2_018887 [Carnegiea gigantea]